MRTVIALALLSSAWVSVAFAQTTEGSEDAESGEARAQEEAQLARTSASAVALARALDERLTVWRNGRRQVYVWHCRAARPGCRARIVAVAQLLAEAARRYTVDPFLLAAMAIKESGLNPFAAGAAGERGVVQLHPRGVGSRVRFVRSEGYRRRCERSAGACQKEVIDAGARLVSAAIARCGDVLEGLGRYNSGICQSTAYSARVMEERQNLLQMAKRQVQVAQLERNTADQGS